MSDSEASILDFIKQFFPGKDPKQVFAGNLAKEIYGPLPKYSTRRADNAAHKDEETYQISATTKTDDGNFVIPYFIDKNARNSHTARNGEVFIVFQRRSDKGPNDEDRYGMLGGYGNNDYATVDGNKDRSKGEGTRQGALRELSEELRDDHSKPILNIDPSRLKILDSDIDFQKNVHWTGFGCALTSKEFAKVKTHSERMANDPVYRDDVRDASEGEVKDIYVKPLREILAMGEEQFTYPHEFRTLEELSRQLNLKMTAHGTQL